MPAVRRRGCVLRVHPSGAEHQAGMELDGEKGKELEVEQITELDVEKAKELIDQKLAEEEEEEKVGS